jgi:hypothetical protein
MKPNEGEAGTIGLTVALSTAGPPSRDLHVVVTPANEDERFSIDRSVVTIRIWREGLDVVRGTISHPQSRTTSYFQGNAALLRMAEALSLRLVRKRSARRASS